ncbi:DUF1634 domain-containing protein [Paraburkholderia nodosa]|uniref:DUF1634 domain-containing protein n=1 Tax=Paraburkholderia nodosa TaxID=392320 RepID=UPI000686EA7F|nr:DUF1634 domain-containing protein [Paraburkholderia nodosa]
MDLAPGIPPKPRASARLERLLAALLHYGTWAGSCAMAAGIALRWSASAAVEPFGGAALTVGVCIIILLPVARLMLMLAVYTIERDYRFASIAAFVLLIVIAGCVVGVALGPLGG